MTTLAKPLAVATVMTVTAWPLDGHACDGEDECPSEHSCVDDACGTAPASSPPLVPLVADRRSPLRDDISIGDGIPGLDLNGPVASSRSHPFTRLSADDDDDDVNAGVIVGSILFGGAYIGTIIAAAATKPDHIGSDALGEAAVPIGGPPILMSNYEFETLGMLGLIFSTVSQTAGFGTLVAGLARL